MVLMRAWVEPTRILAKSIWSASGAFILTAIMRGEIPGQPEWEGKVALTSARYLARRRRAGRAIGRPAMIQTWM